MYPLALDLIRSSLAELDKQKIAYRIEGFMWHQGENDMFNEQYMARLWKEPGEFPASWRRDLKTPDLKFYIGELCTKTIWGMDLRPRMYAISQGQKAVTEADRLAEYIPTSHVGVEIGGGVGLHYHYGTLGQLEHGVNYADAYLRTIGKSKQNTSAAASDGRTKKAARSSSSSSPAIATWKASGLLFRNSSDYVATCSQDNEEIALQVQHRRRLQDVRMAGSRLGPAGYYDTFGPELSFGRALHSRTCRQHCHCQVHSQRFPDERLDAGRKHGQNSPHLSSVHCLHQGFDQGAAGQRP